MPALNTPYLVARLHGAGAVLVSKANPEQQWMVSDWSDGTQTVNGWPINEQGRRGAYGPIPCISMTYLSSGPIEDAPMEDPVKRKRGPGRKWPKGTMHAVVFGDGETPGQGTGGFRATVREVREDVAWMRRVMPGPTWKREPRYQVAYIVHVIPKKAR